MHPSINDYLMGRLQSGEMRWGLIVRLSHLPQIQSGSMIIYLTKLKRTNQMRLIDLKHESIYRRMSKNEFLIKDPDGNSWWIEINEIPENSGDWQGFVYNNLRECRKTKIGRYKNLINQATVDILQTWWKELNLLQV